MLEILENNKDYIINYYNNNGNLKELANIYNCDQRTIRKSLKTWGVQKRNHILNKNVLDGMDDEILRMYKLGYSACKIAKILKVYPGSIRNRCKKFNLDFSQTVNPAKIYSADDNFFQVIDNEEKAYLLGLWMSDGCIQNNYIQLSMLDKDIIEKAKYSLEYTGPIYQRISKMNNKILYKLQIYSKKLFKDLNDKGCCPNKSLTLKYPHDYVPKALMRHFIRGVMDGDGCIYRSEKGYYQICITGTKEICEGINQYSPVIGGITHVKKRKGKNTYYWRIGKRSDIKTFLSFLYDGANIYLDRKNILYNAFINNNYNNTIQEISNWLNELGLSTNIKDGIIHSEEKSIAIHYCDFKTQLKADPKYNYKLYKKYLEGGTNLFTIFEDEWVCRKEQVKNFITAKLGIFKRKIYARQCEIKEVDKQTAAQFISNNHIQPTNNGGLINFGLFNNEELLGLVQLRTHHRNNLDITISRICFLSSFLIIGGFSRLVKHTFRWCEQNGYKRLITWSDNRWTTGQSYINSGFIKYKDLPSDYSYIRENEQNRKSKQSMSKDKIGCPKNISEREWTSNMGYSRIWDCGKIAFVYNI